MDSGDTQGIHGTTLFLIGTQFEIDDPMKIVVMAFLRLVRRFLWHPLFMLPPPPIAATKLLEAIKVGQQVVASESLSMKHFLAINQQEEYMAKVQFERP